jgi:hypothetical protein
MQVYVSMWLQIPLKIGGVFDVIKCVTKDWSCVENSLHLSFSGQDMLSGSLQHCIVAGVVLHTRDNTLDSVTNMHHDPHSNHGPIWNKVFLSLHLRLCPYCQMFPTCRSGYCSHIWLRFVYCRLGPSSTREALRKAVVELSTVFFFSSIFSAMQVSWPLLRPGFDFPTRQFCLSWKAPLPDMTSSIT